MIAPADRLNGIELSLIRRINALARPDSLNLGIGEPNLEPDDTLREMARAAATKSWKYTPNAGTSTLRELVAAELDLPDESHVCITAGTEEGLYSIFQAFVNPGDEVLVPNPGFVAYPTLIRLAGGVPVSYDLEPPEWPLDAEAMARRITDRTRIIVVNTPSNPLGAIADARSLEAVTELAMQRGCLVVCDEVYEAIWYDAPPPSMIGRGENVIVVGGMSKSHGMTGLRLGWAVAEPALLKTIITAHQYVATCASAFTQSLAESILANREWNRSWLERMRKQFGLQRAAALAAIERHLDVALVPPAGAFYAFVPLPVCETLPFVMTLVNEANVLVVPGSAFGSHGEGFIRISFAASVETIAAGIERIGRRIGESIAAPRRREETSR